MRAYMCTKCGFRRIYHRNESMKYFFLLLTLFRRRPDTAAVILHRQTLTYVRPLLTIDAAIGDRLMFHQSVGRGTRRRRRRPSLNNAAAASLIRLFCVIVIMSNCRLMKTSIAAAAGFDDADGGC